MRESSLFKAFVESHKPQLVSSGVPEHLWPELHKKIIEETFDSGSAFIFSTKEFESLEGVGRAQYSVHVINEEGISKDDPNAVYLIDHAWTFTADKVTEHLTEIPGLLSRMCTLMGVTSDIDCERIEETKRYVWRFAQTYSLGGQHLPIEVRTPIWYVMDELGSCIAHSDDPNFRTVPFIYLPTQATYSLLFPIQDVNYGDVVTRNYVEGVFENATTKSALLIPWEPSNFKDVNFQHVEPSPEYFLGGHIEETLPNLENLSKGHDKTKLKVFSEYSFINDNLTNSDFEIVSDECDADILWKLTHFTTYKELSESSPHKYINQFPFEYILNIKDLFGVVCRRNQKVSYNEGTLDTFPLWLPTTYNLKTELDKFVSYYRRRNVLALDNHWICKPFNLARSLDSHITNNLDFLVRLPLTGPKIAQKYIEDPVLFERPDCGKVKFDIRYVILLRSVNPLSVHMYTNFFLRFANLPFAMDNFEEYEQHFTVMNYGENTKLYALKCADFKDEWHRQYPHIEWNDVEGDIFDMFCEIFTAATSKPPPLGIAHSPQSRALYAADLMLSWDQRNGKTVIQPKILEVNWMPDCQRACDYYPNFYNDIFSSLFLDKPVETCLRIL